MESRDLFLGLFLIVGAGWIAASTGIDAASTAYLLAIVGCALAGVTYLVGGTLVGETVAGRPLTRLRVRAVAQAFIGVAIVALGVDGYLDAGDAFSAGVAVVGVLVLLISLALWYRGGADGIDGDLGG